MNKRSYFIIIICSILLALNASDAQPSKEKTIESIDWIMNNATADGAGYKFDGTSVTEANIGNVFLELYTISKNETYLNFAQNIANWLIENANKTEEYIRWAKTQNGDEFYISGANSAQDYGSTPQIGYFFLNLYSITQNLTYLSYAEGAADWLIFTAQNCSLYPDQFRWNETTSSSIQYTSLRRGAANVGNYLITLYSFTQNSTHLFYAEGAANFLINVTTITQNYSYYERLDSANIYFSLRDGAAGIGSFFLNMYYLTNNSTYFDYANKTGYYLMSVANGTVDSCYWSNGIGSSIYLTGFLVGAAGIADFLLELYTTTNDYLFLSHSVGAQNWIITKNSLLIEDSFIFNYSLGSFNTYIDYVFGNAGIGLFFFNLYSFTQNLTHLDYVRKTANKILNSDITGGSYTANFHRGVSGMVYFLLKCDPDWDNVDTWDEIFTYGTDPFKWDTSGNGFSDYEEIYAVFGYQTDPNIPDTDSDGLSDYDEVTLFNTDPLKWDTSENGLSDFAEVRGTYNNGTSHGFGPTNPLLWDSDGDGLNDLAEIMGTFNNGTEHGFGPTNPNRWDSDFDGLSDYEEIYYYGTDPNNPDTDGDGIIDSLDDDPFNKKSVHFDYITYYMLSFGALFGFLISGAVIALIKRI